MAGWFRCYWGSKTDWKQSSEIQARSFKVTIQPRFKKWYLFFVTKVFHEEVTMFHSHMRFYVMQWLATRFYGSLSVYSQPLPSDSQRSKRFRLVSEQRNTEEGDFRFWPREKWNESQKVKEGGGEGRKHLQKTPRFWKPAFASERSAWLARLVEQCWHVSIKGLFHTERSCLVRDTHINFLWLLFILVGKIFPPMQEHFI